MLDGTLRLLHPLVPFVTEHLWDRMPWPAGVDRPRALPLAPWPEVDPRWVDAGVQSDFQGFQELIAAVRSLRKEYGVGEGERVAILVSAAHPGFQAFLEGEGPRLDQLARVTSVTFGEAPEGAVGASAVLPHGVGVFLPLEGLIDLGRERARLAQEIARLRGQWQAAEAKLVNVNFTARAPADVVAKERDKAAVFRDQFEKLEQKLHALGGA